MQEYILLKRCILPVKSGVHRDYKHMIYACNRKCGQVFNVEYIKGLLAIVLLQYDNYFKNKIKQCKTYNYCCSKLSLQHEKLLGEYI